MINRTIITGRLTSTPELKKSETGTNMTRFRIAHDARNEHTDFINIVAFNKVAEIISLYCKKGMKVTIEGRLTTHRDINDVVYTEILLDNIEIPDRPKTKPETAPNAPVMPNYDDGDELPW